MGYGLRGGFNQPFQGGIHEKDSQEGSFLKGGVPESEVGSELGTVV